MSFPRPARATSCILTIGLVATLGCAADSDGSTEGEDGSSSSGAPATTSGASSTGPNNMTDTTPGTSSTASATGSTGAGSSDETGASGSTGEDNSHLVDERPYDIFVPEGYDPDAATPVVMLLHGYGASAALQNVYFRFTPDAEEHGYLLVLPDGLVDGSSSRFWNATDACCNFGGDPVDDVAYLGAVLDDVEAQYNVDPKRVYLVGHSNGGFMSHRLACDIGDRIAAIVSLAGATWDDASLCPAESRVNILQVHGTDDDTIQFGGGANAGVAYPSANDTVAQWADKNGCRSALAGEATIDLEPDLKGPETLQQNYGDCPPGGDVGLWTIEGGSHIPEFDEAWADAVWAYLEAHPKP